MAFTSDKASVFRSNQPEPKSGDGVTQFGRALWELNIDIICANSAPAKGRVERAGTYLINGRSPRLRPQMGVGAGRYSRKSGSLLDSSSSTLGRHLICEMASNLTLQDRLVKELRLRGISTIDAANAFAPEFMADYNARFGKEPQNSHDAHRPLQPTEVLDDIFTWQETRKLSRSLTFNYQRQLYIVADTEETRPLAGHRLTVVELADGTVQARHEGRLLPLTRFAKDDAHVSQGAIVSNKLLAGALQQIRSRQAQKDLEKLATLRTKREKRLLLERMKSAG